MIGSSLFALGSFPGFASWAGSAAANLCYFIGAWGFTYAGFVQWSLSGARTMQWKGKEVLRADWMSAATQSVGTILFNVSTAAALRAHALEVERLFSWSPDAAGSVAFLISGGLAMRAYRHSNRAWDPRKAGWWATQVNMVGCIAFGVSAVGAFILGSGATLDPNAANIGTFVGALCFFAASAITLVAWSRSRRTSS